MNMQIADLSHAVELDRAALAAVFGAAGTLKYTSRTSSGSWSITSKRRYSVYKTVTVGGFLGIPILLKLNVMHNWLGPFFEAAAEHGAEASHAVHSLATELGLMGVSVLVASGGSSRP